MGDGWTKAVAQQLEAQERRLGEGKESKVAAAQMRVVGEPLTMGEPMRV